MRNMTRTDAKMIAEELFKLFKKNSLAQRPMEKYIGITEAAELLGMPKNTLYKKVQQIPHVKRGRQLLFKESSLKMYMEGA